MYIHFTFPPIGRPDPNPEMYVEEPKPKKIKK